jgi:RecA/RadA recombinase
MSVRPEDYEAIVSAINRKYEGSLHRGNQQIRCESISTGSPELDIAMGGGVPQGRWTRFFGGYGSTKTMTAYAVIASAQQMGLLCAFYNIEKRYERDFAERKGINTKELTLVEGTTIEEIGDKMESLLGVVHLHVLDSCTMAVSEDELAAEVRDWRPGINARVWGKVFRRLNERFDMTDNTVILINQMRMKKGPGRTTEWYEDAEGGRVFDHQSSMSVLFRTGLWLWRTEDGGFADGNSKRKLADGKDNTVDNQISPQGREIKIRVEKSSVCRPFRTATLHYDLDTLEYDRIYEYVKAAKHYGVVQTHGAYYHYVDADGEVTKMHGEKQLREFIDSSPQLQKYIHETAIEAAELRDA